MRGSTEWRGRDLTPKEVEERRKPPRQVDERVTEERNWKDFAELIPTTDLRLARARQLISRRTTGFCRGVSDIAGEEVPWACTLGNLNRELDGRSD